nr:GntR family transcriptional regulator [Bifidobacterium sp. DSM 109958]
MTVSSTSGQPIYGQIKRQIREAVLAGELKPGQALPSLRRLAKELRISVLTVTRAYGELADEGVVENVQGKGTFVAEHGDERLRRQLIARVDASLDRACADASAAGIPLLDLLSMLEARYDAYQQRP